uniref:EOG090X0CKL n=1 Tax=Megafenestra aurita TaxID=2291010 RepID=A0A4Y7NHE5_9CRUS|nr:EOG090X0CKL [Megafenestra aurita]
MATFHNGAPIKAVMLSTTTGITSNLRKLINTETDSSKNEDHDSSAPKVPHEIYKGMLTSQVKAVKTFSFGTSLVGISMQPILYENASAPDSSLPMMVALYMTVGMFTFVTPFLIHFVTKKYVTDIVYDPESDQYTASVFRFIPMKRKIQFKLEDISVPDVPGAFTSFLVKNIPLLCTPKDFSYPEHYIKFMGYDKPINLHLRTNEDNSSKSISSKSGK